MIRLPNFPAFFNATQPMPGTPSPEFKGYRLNLDEPLYREAPGINVSILKAPTACDMLHEYVKPPKEEWTASGAYPKSLGTIAHWCALEPHKIATIQEHTLLCETDGLATKRAMQQREDNPGKLLVTQELLDDAMACMAAVKANHTAMRLLRGEEGNTIATEASGFVFDPEFALWRKWRVDVLPRFGNYMADVKTTRTDGSERAWIQECYKFGYFHQAAWYLDSHELLTGERRPWFFWVVITTDAPFKCHVFAIRNMRRGNPLYDEKSKFRWARLSLGLEAVEAGDEDAFKFATPRLPTFIQCAQETADMQSALATLNEETLRRLWPAWEHEDPIVEIV